MHSTSKCDNLNMACDWIDTEVACLNGADTMLHWGCMVRASIWIKDQGYDIDLIDTEVACLNDAATVLHWSCMDMTLLRV